MNTKIREIYNGLNQAENWNDENTRTIEQKIEKEFSEMQSTMNWKEFERYRDKIFAVSELAKEEGFINGFKYAVLLMTECYTGNKDIIVKP